MLKAIISEEEFAALEEENPLREYYAPKEGETEGTRYLQVEATEGWALEDIQGLKHVLSSERSVTAKLKKRIEAFGDLDPEAAREALSKVEEMSNWTPTDVLEEKVKAREDQLHKKYSQESNSNKKRTEQLFSEIERHLVTAAATKALSEHKGNTTLLLPHVRSQIKVEETSEGRFVAQVIDEAGNPRISMRPGSQENMSISELVEGMKNSKEYSQAFEGTGHSGSGAQPTQKTIQTPADTISKEVDWTDQQALSSNIEDIASGKVIVTMPEKQH